MKAITPLFCSLLLAATANTAMAESSTKSGFVVQKRPPDPKVVHTKDDEPAVLEADSMAYDRDQDIVTAEGHVSVVQGSRVLLSDKLEYHRKEDQVIAIGHVSMLEETGDVYFAEHMLLKHELKVGTVEQFQGRLKDGSIVTAKHADRISDAVTNLFDVAYTPCKIICGKSPLWQIDADKAVYDTDEQEITYKNATIDAFGLPVFYTPYFSHPTPKADNKSGLLMPFYNYSRNLGSTVRIPAYYVFGQDQDVTLTPMLTTQEKPVLLGQYRQRFDSGPFLFNGSITDPQKRDANGALIPGNEVRGYLDTDGKFKINDEWDWGFEVKRATDDTYLRRYFNDGTPVLNSKAYVQGHSLFGNDRSFLSAEALSFQGMRAEDNPDQIPLILPLVSYSTQTAPDRFGGRISLDTSAMSLTRNDGIGSRRLASQARWGLPFLTEGGQLIDIGAQMRADIYSVNDVPQGGKPDYSGTTGRLIPEINGKWRYPFINRFSDTASLIVEPTVTFAISPQGGNPLKLPNEDSQIPEFTDVNLFDYNRYAGWDRVETGPRTTYGLRSQYQWQTGRQLELLAGQEYRVNGSSQFPIANDLNSHFSDYVARLALTLDLFDLAYRLKLDRETLAANRQEVDATAHYERLSGRLSYLSLRHDPILLDKQEVGLDSNLQVTPLWSLSAGARKDLNLGQFTSISGGVTFKNECIGISTMVGRNYARDRDVKPSTSVNVLFTLQNLGSQ